MTMVDRAVVKEALALAFTDSHPPHPFRREKSTAKIHLASSRRRDSMWLRGTSRRLSCVVW